MKKNALNAIWTLKIKIENKELRIESKAGFGITEKKKIIEKTGK